MSEVKQKKSIRPKKASASAERKEIAVPVEPKEVVTPAPALEPKKATRVDPGAFWRMQHAAASVATAKAEIEAARMSKLYILSLIDPKGRVAAVEKQMEEAKKRMESHQKTHRNFKESIEAHIGRPLANIAIDPDSGEISDIPNVKH